MRFPDESQQLLPRILLVDDGVANVGTVKTGNEYARIIERQPLPDLGARLHVRSGGQRDARHGGKTFVQQRQLQILRTEIVAPLRYAMRFVDGEQGDT